MSRTRRYFATALAWLIFRLARVLVRLSDRRLLGILNLLGRIPGIANSPLGSQVQEVRDMLLKGEPYTDIIRKMVLDADPYRAVCTIRGGFLYGEEP